jgi:hypothetical protein
MKGQGVWAYQNTPPEYTMTFEFKLNSGNLLLVTHVHNPPQRIEAATIKPGQGGLEIGKWHQGEFTVTKDRVRIVIDGNVVVNGAGPPNMPKQGPGGFFGQADTDIEIRNVRLK